MVRRQANNKGRLSLPIVFSVMIHFAVVSAFAFESMWDKGSKQNVEDSIIMVSVVSSAAPSIPASPVIKEVKEEMVEESKGATEPESRKEEIKKLAKDNLPPVEKKIVQERKATELANNDDIKKKIERKNSLQSGSGFAASNAYSVINNPKLKSQTPPSYPRRAIQRGWQGVVIVEAVVDKTGQPKEARVYKSSGFQLLDKAAIKAVKKWEFDIANAVNLNRYALVRVPVNFVINQS
jgi:protein TonB